MTINPALVSAYRWHRNHAAGNRYPQRPGPNPAAEAIAAARVDVAAGKARFPQSYGWNPQWELRTSRNSSYSLRWIEKPSECGLRFVGYADKIVRLDHTGWYVDNDQSETVRAVVFQLPGRHGVPLFIGGYEDWNNGKADSDGPVALDFTNVFRGESPYYVKPQWGGHGYWTWTDNPSEHDGCRDAAHHADHIAELLAESEREYQAASFAGHRYAELGAEIATARKDALTLLAERRAVMWSTDDGKAPAAICSAIRDKLDSILDTIRKARAKRAKLAEGDFVSDWIPGWNTRDTNLRDAFNESAGAAVV